MALTRITKGVIKPNENYQAGIVTATGLDLNGNADISGDLNVGGILTYEDVTSIDAVGIITAQKGIHVGAGVSAVGVGTFGSLDISGDIDVDGHTNLDNVNIAGVTTTIDHIIIDADDKKLQIGDGQDLQLYHSGGHTFIENSTGNFQFSGTGDIQFVHAGSSNEFLARFKQDDSVELFFDGERRLSTTNDGIKVEDEIELYGTNPIIRFTDTNNNPDYAIHGSAGVFLIQDTTNTVNRLRIDPSDGHFDIIGDFNIANDLDVDGHTNLDNVSVAGVSTFVGNVNIANDTGKIQVGASQDLQIYHDYSGGSENSHIRQTSNKHLQITAYTAFNRITGTWGVIKDSNSHNIIRASAGSDVKLYFNNGEKLSTTNTGVAIIGVCSATSYTGDGSNLTGISGVSVANQADNRLITATGTTDALNAESLLTFDGDTLHLVSTGGDDNNSLRIDGTNNTSGGQVHQFVIENRGESAWVNFKTSTANGSATDRIRINSISGQVRIYNELYLTDGVPLYLGNSNDLSLFHSSNTSVIRYNHSVGGLHFRNNSNDDQMVIDSSGRLLLGSSFSSNVNTFKYSIKESGSENAAILFLDTDNMRGGICGATRGNNELITGTGNMDFVVGSLYSDTHIIRGVSGNQNGAIGMTIEGATGHIGINNTNPTLELEMSFTSGTTQPTSGTTPKGIGLSFGNTDGHNGGIWFSGDVGGDQGIAGISGTRTSNYDVDLRFYTNNSNSARAFSERMRITPAGKIGMGAQTNPQGQLDIRTTDDDDAIRLVNTATGNNGIQWWNEYGGLTKRVSMDYGEGDANFDIACFRGDAQDNRPYGNVRILTGDYTSPSVNFRVTTLGSVHMPNQPSFSASRSSGHVYGANPPTAMVFNSVDFNVGNDYNNSNGIFTAPIAGKYQFSFSGMAAGGTGDFQVRFLKNGGGFFNSNGSGRGYGTFEPYGFTVLIDLAINDTVQIKIYSSNTSCYIYAGTIWNKFSGRLVG